MQWDHGRAKMRVELLKRSLAPIASGPKRKTRTIFVASNINPLVPKQCESRLVAALSQANKLYSDIPPPCLVSYSLQNARHLLSRFIADMSVL